MPVFIIVWGCTGSCAVQKLACIVNQMAYSGWPTDLVKVYMVYVVSSCSPMLCMLCVLSCHVTRLHHSVELSILIDRATQY